jgi:hypothetical protein
VCERDGGSGTSATSRDDIDNWAIFEPTTVEVLDVRDLRRDDPDLLAAVELFGLAVA